MAAKPPVRSATRQAARTRAHRARGELGRRQLLRRRAADRPLLRRAPPTRAHTRGRLVGALNASGIGLNVVAGDQYVADVIPARTFRGEFERRGIAPQVLSRAVEDSGTVTSTSSIDGASKPT